MKDINTDKKRPFRSCQKDTKHQILVRISLTDSGGAVQLPKSDPEGDMDASMTQWEKMKRFWSVLQENCFVAYTIKVLKFLIGIYALVDIFSDALQTKKYFQNSPFWNVDHHCHKVTSCNYTDHAEEPIKLHWGYFPGALVGWALTPVLFMIWLILNFRKKYPLFHYSSRHKIRSFITILLSIVALVPLFFISVFTMYFKMPFDIVRLSLVELIPEKWINRQKWKNFGRTKWLEFADVDLL